MQVETNKLYLISPLPPRLIPKSHPKPCIVGQLHVPHARCSSTHFFEHIARSSPQGKQAGHGDFVKCFTLKIIVVNHFLELLDRGETI